MVYLLATPVCILLTLTLWLFGMMRGKENAIDGTHPARTILITGSSQTKALHLCRVLGKAGHRIIVTDTSNFRWSGTQYCKYVDKFYTVPLSSPTNDDAVEKYVSTICEIAQDERVDWFVPVSWIECLEIDLLIAQELKKMKSNIRCLTMETFAQGIMLDNKLRFMSECKKLGLRVPDNFRIEHLSDLVPLREQGIFKRKHFFLKPLISLNEDRENFTQIPDDKTEFETYINNFKGKIRPDNPFFVCEFIAGKEYSSGVLCSHGEIFAITVNSSCSRQTLYEDIEHDEIKNWTIDFCRKTQLTGLVSFDFIEEKKTGLIYCLECNPRAHSNMVSFNYDSKLETAIRYALDGHKRGHKPISKPIKMPNHFPIAPRPQSPPIYWLYHEVGNLLLRRRSLASFINLLRTGRDGVYMQEDPLPFLFSNTLVMIDLLAQVLVTGKRFNVTNHCLGKLS